MDAQGLQSQPLPQTRCSLFPFHNLADSWCFFGRLGRPILLYISYIYIYTYVYTILHVCAHIYIYIYIYIYISVLSGSLLPRSTHEGNAKRLALLGSNLLQRSSLLGGYLGMKKYSTCARLPYGRKTVALSAVRGP